MRGTRVGMGCKADFAANIWILARNSTLQTARARVIARCRDLFSASPGTAMVRAFVNKLFEDPKVTRIQTDPDPRNARAIRCYEKAGLRAVGEVQTPDGLALLMVCERPARAP